MKTMLHRQVHKKNMILKQTPNRKTYDFFLCVRQPIHAPLRLRGKNSACTRLQHHGSNNSDTETTTTPQKGSFGALWKIVWVSKPDVRRRFDETSRTDMSKIPAQWYLNGKHKYFQNLSVQNIIKKLSPCKPWKTFVHTSGLLLWLHASNSYAENVVNGKRTD